MDATALFGLVGNQSGELLTHKGDVLVHWDPEELAYLIPSGARVVKLYRVPEHFIHLSQHPQLLGVVTWPLEKRDFR